MARCKLGGILTLALALGIGSPTLLSAESPVGAPSASVSRNPLGSGLHIDNIGLAKVMAHFSRITGANIVVNWHALAEAGVTRETPISLDLENVTFRKALQVVLDQASPSMPLTWIIEDNVLEITTQAEADKRMVTRIYVVTDLVSVPPSVGQPPSLDLSTTSVTVSSGSSGSNGATGQVFTSNTTTTNTPLVTTQTRADELITLITSVIRPDIWVNNGGTATIRYFSGKLIVTAPESVQNAIGGNTGLRIGH